MGKYIGFIICILAGICLITLALVRESLYCTKHLCRVQSRIAFVNLVINRTDFPPDEISHIQCKSQYQPSKTGKKRFYILELKTENLEYNLGSFKNYKQCTTASKPLKSYVAGRTDQLIYESGLGFTNALGLLMGILMFVIGIVILTTPAEETDDELDENT